MHTATAVGVREALLSHWTLATLVKDQGVSVGQVVRHRALFTAIISMVITATLTAAIAVAITE